MSMNYNVLTDNNENDEQKSLLHTSDLGLHLFMLRI